MKKQTKEIRFEKVIENDYTIDFMLDIIFPLTSVILGFAFGYCMYYDYYVFSILSGYALFFTSIIYCVALFLYFQGRKVYYRRTK
jgi:hypothetical protein